MGWQGVFYFDVWRETQVILAIDDSTPGTRLEKLAPILLEELVFEIGPSRGLVLSLPDLNSCFGLSQLSIPNGKTRFQKALCSHFSGDA